MRLECQFHRLANLLCGTIKCSLPSTTQRSAPHLSLVCPSASLDAWPQIDSLSLSVCYCMQVKSLVDSITHSNVSIFFLTTSRTAVSLLIQTCKQFNGSFIIFNAINWAGEKTVMVTGEKKWFIFLPQLLSMMDLCCPPMADSGSAFLRLCIQTCLSRRMAMSPYCLNSPWWSNLRCIRQTPPALLQESANGNKMFYGHGIHPWMNATQCAGLAGCCLHSTVWRPHEHYCAALTIHTYIQPHMQ